MTAHHARVARRSPPVDWPRLILELRGAGMTLSAIADTLGRPITTVHGWQSLDAEPRHSDGEALLALWGSIVRDSEGQAA